MDFKHFLDNSIRRALWDEFRHQTPTEASYKIREFIAKNQKNIFLSSLFKFCKEHGIESVLSQKNAIIKLGKKHGSSHVDTSSVIFTCLGNEGLRQFKRKITASHVWTIVIFLSGLTIGYFARIIL